MTAAEAIALIATLVKGLIDVVTELTKGNLTPEQAIARARELHALIPDDVARLDAEAAALEAAAEAADLAKPAGS